MPKNEFAGLLPESFEEFRSEKFWQGFFEARGGKVRVTPQLGI